MTRAWSWLRAGRSWLVGRTRCEDPTWRTTAELEEKLADYLGAGVREVWVMDPAERSVTVHRADRDPRTRISPDILEGDDVLSGFRLPLATLFAV